MNFIGTEIPFYGAEKLNFNIAILYLKKAKNVRKIRRPVRRTGNAAHLAAAGKEHVNVCERGWVGVRGRVRDGRELWSTDITTFKAVRDTD